MTEKPLQFLFLNLTDTPLEKKKMSQTVLQKYVDFKWTKTDTNNIVF